MKTETKKKIVIIGGTLLFCAAMMVLYFFGVVPKKVEGEKTVTVELSYKNATYTYSQLVTESQTVHDVLVEYNERFELGYEYSQSEYGAFVTSFKNTANDDANGYYYMFKINGVYSNFGVSSAAIKDGDTIVFEYGVAAYDESWNTTGVELQNTASADGSENLSFNRPLSGSQIAVIVCCSITAAALLGIVLTVILRKSKQKTL